MQENEKIYLYIHRKSRKYVYNDNITYNQADFNSSLFPLALFRMSDQLKKVTSLQIQKKSNFFGRNKKEIKYRKPNKLMLFQSNPI